MEGITKGLSVHKPQKNYLSNVLAICNRKTGIKKNEILRIATAYENQIRHLDGITRAQQLIINIPLIAEQYGGRKDLEKDVLSACMDLVENRFGFLSISEIKTAYEMWASGETKIQGAEMYGGEFNAGQLGKVLGGYREYRKNILSTFLKEKEETEREEKEKKRSKILANKFNLEFPKKVMAAKVSFKDWQDVPPFWFDAMKKREWIQLSKDEYLKYWNQSHTLAIDEIKKRKEAETNFFRKYNSDDMIVIRKTISRQLAVFEKVILNAKWAIPQPEKI